MSAIRSGVAHGFFAPSLADPVAETSAMSTGSKRTVAKSEVRLMIATRLTTADRSRGVCHVNVVMMAAPRQSATTTAYVIHIKLVWIKPASATIMVTAACDGWLVGATGDRRYRYTAAVYM